MDWRTAYRGFSLLLAIVFALVGLTFLLAADGVLAFFNQLSHYVGLPASPTQGTGFFLILAVGYMYLVTLLAYLMYRHPDDAWFPALLTHGKLASAVLSLGLFLFHRRFLIYLTNGLVDGLLGFSVLTLSRLRRRT
jgi:hypothetical protein